MKYLLVVTALASVAACGPAYTTRPKAVVAVTSAVPVPASFDKTWEASVNWFAERNITIRTIDKASGVLVANPGVDFMRNDPKLGTGKNYAKSLMYADCGTHSGTAYDPTLGVYTVKVTPAGAGADLLANARYEQDGAGVGNKFQVCVSTGKWEREFVDYVKARATR